MFYIGTWTLRVTHWSERLGIIAVQAIVGVVVDEPPPDTAI